MISWGLKVAFKQLGFKWLWTSLESPSGTQFLPRTGLTEYKKKLRRFFPDLPNDGAHISMTGFEGGVNDAEFAWLANAAAAEFCENLQFHLNQPWALLVIGPHCGPWRLTGPMGCAEVRADPERFISGSTKFALGRKVLMGS